MLAEGHGSTEMDSLFSWTDQHAPATRAGPRGGGDEETRTPDPLLAKEMLYQLSYVPREDVACGGGDGGRFWTRTRDLCLIRAVL